MKRLLLTTLTLVLPILPLSAQKADSPIGWTNKKIAAAAERLVSSLDEDQKKKALFALKDEERKNWHFVPFERKGLPLKEMDEQQKRIATSLLTTVLSQRGYQKATEIQMLEHQLSIIEKNPERRDAGKYYFIVFGEPHATEPWGLRFEGHHLSLSWTFANGEVEATPSFFGGNPGKVAEGPLKGFRVMAAEEDQARKLFTSLPAEQQKKALIADKAPRDILTKELQKAERLPDEGILVSELSEEHQKDLQKVALLYLGRNTGAIARHDLAELAGDGWKDVRFAWAGSTKKGEGHYYRIQGDDILLEYANTQNEAAHPHCVYRNFKNDFGDDLLRAHWEEHHADEKGDK